MIVRGLYQQALDFLRPKIENTFPTLPIIWLSDRQVVAHKKEGAYPLLEIKVPDTNEFVTKMFSGGQYPGVLKGLGYVSFQFEISLIGQPPEGSVIWEWADNALTTFLLNLPHDKYTDHLGYNENFITIDGYGYTEVERDETKFPLTKYTAVISVNQFLGKRKDYQELQIRDFNYNVELVNKLEVQEETNGTE